MAKTKAQKKNCSNYDTSKILVVAAILDCIRLVLQIALELIKFFAQAD